MKIMAIDLGKVRTGVAISDGNEVLAYPICVIKEKKKGTLLRNIVCLVKEYGAEKLIIGNPLNMDGSSGQRSIECIEIARELSIILETKVILWDERQTTILANRHLNYANVRGKRRKKAVDQLAAVVILESYLNYRKNFYQNN